MTNAQVVDELKTKRLPTFGTLAERKERLKKHHGISSSSQDGPSNDHAKENSIVG